MALFYVGSGGATLVAFGLVGMFGVVVVGVIRLVRAAGRSAAAPAGSDRGAR